MSEKDELYLCLLYLRSTCERLAATLVCYLAARPSEEGESTILVPVMVSLRAKQEKIANRLDSCFPEYMEQKRWHEAEVMSAQLLNLSEESREELQQLCMTEMQALQAVGSLFKE
ncbi:hypothetical protein ACWJJH_12775 [Endozoicomonadaceae bacterium StTr2]